MIVQVVTIPVQPAKKDEFYVVVKATAEESLKEKGISVYSASWQAENPDNLVIVEEYADQAALDAHYAADHTKNFFRHVGKAAAAPVEVRRYTVSAADVQMMGG